MCVHAGHSPYAYSIGPVAYSSYAYEAPRALQYSSVDLASYPYSGHPYSSLSLNNVVGYHDDSNYVVAVAGSTAQHSYPTYTDHSHGKVIPHLAGGSNLFGYNGLSQHVATHLIAGSHNAAHHNVLVHNAVSQNVVGNHHNVHAATHTVAVVPPHHEATYTAVTKGAVHKAPLPGHVLSQKSINVASAPGTF